MAVNPKVKTCACPEHTDSTSCYDLRYYGYSPVRRGRPGDYTIMDYIEGEPNLDDDDGECECWCHDHESGDDYIDGEEDW